MDSQAGIAHLYAGWELVNRELLHFAERATPEELAMGGSGEQWPVWARLAHVAGARLYWLCSVLGEERPADPGYSLPSGEGWEDHLDQPRSAEEVAIALRSSWGVVERCRREWTPERLQEEVIRVRGDGVAQVHTRQLILIRMITHDAFHAGEISQLLGERGSPELNPWREMQLR